MRAHHLLALILWRGGLLLAAVAALYEGARLLLRFIDVPGPVRTGLALLLAGLGLVMVSLVLERLQDLQAEKELRE